MNYGTNGYSFSDNLWNGIKHSFRQGSSLTKLIYINIGLFLFIKVVHMLFILTGGAPTLSYGIFLDNLGLPAYWNFFLHKPWTIVTYMFTHFSFLHLLFNMLWLYWFGSFFLQHFTQYELTGMYILGGLSGGLFYLLCYNFLPLFEASLYNTSAIGASASVMAIVFAVCCYLPHRYIHVFVIGSVKLIYIAIFIAAIDILSIPSANAGGHIAHLGGALFGYFFIVGIRHNINLTRGIVFIFFQINKLFSVSPRPHYKKHVAEMNEREYNEYKKRKEEQINKILDKISKSGYESLTRKEKEILFKSGK
ncbi:rhomboid family intramembrane serine protease [Odoribacter lunatus]|uniref:rhomboid family intramembrane serine protease n=1 Tax=Odoribacter lunatus TaxID=2941335 RepID=UPI00203F4B85|nr:rhomboid family intramembrane serine protease [Odoribacter lunatus]